MLRLAWNMCHRKRRYSVREANRVVQRINEKGGKQVHQYYCFFCKERHIGKILKVMEAELNEVEYGEIKILV